MYCYVHMCNLLLGDATTTICHRYTPREQLLHHVKHSDILVVATGIPGLIHGSMLKPGCTVIDVGITRVRDPQTGKDKIVGDCDLESKWILYPYLYTLKISFQGEHNV